MTEAHESKHTLETVMRFCADIGLFALDRSRQASCVHATPFCAKTCFNRKLEAAFKGIEPKDVKNDAAWAEFDVEAFNAAWARKRNTKRFRLCTRGEPIATHIDAMKIEALVKANPQTLFWIPTRAWHDSNLIDALMHLDGLKNVRLMLSLDPSDDADAVEYAVSTGISTMFYGDDDNHPLGNENAFYCRKTWKHEIGACKRCRFGCFHDSQKHVWLKQH